MLSICMLITALHPIGGAEILVANLAKELQRRGWKITVISMLPEGDTLAAELRRSSVTVLTLGMRKGFADPRAIWRLAKILKSLKPSILHAHMVEANLLARIARCLAPVPVLISTAHNIREGGKLYDWSYRLTDRLGDLTTNVSAAAARRYAHDRLVPPRRLRVMRNGIDPQHFRPDEQSRRITRRALGLSNDFVWLAIGRLREQKDYPNLLRAFAEVRGATLLIAGDGELRPQLEHLAADLQLTERVRFRGFCSDSATLLSAADGYVLSSRWEGLPLVLLEAAATALPVVATDVGGNSEIVLHGQSGFLVPAADSAALRDAMLRVMATPKSQRLEMGLAGRELVRKLYDMSQIVSAWEAMYWELFARCKVGKASSLAWGPTKDVRAN